MENVKVFKYSGAGDKSLRVIIVDGEPWWFLNDIRLILGMNHNNIPSRLFGENEKAYIHGRGIGFYFNQLVINESGLDRIGKLYFYSQAVDNFLTWIDKEVKPNLETSGGYPSSILGKDCIINSSRWGKTRSVKADKKILQPTLPKSALAEPLKEMPTNELQRADLLIRLAEKEGIPEADRIYLLDIAMRELTGNSLSINLPVRADIMDLPEVTGVGVRRRRRGIGPKRVTYYPVLTIAEELNLSPNVINNFADLHNLKNNCNGCWIPVQTSKGAAREFMYTNEAIETYFEHIA